MPRAAQLFVSAFSIVDLCRSFNDTLHSSIVRLTFLTGIGEFLSQVYGMDPIIINQLMYGVRGARGEFTSGHVKSMRTQERWG